MGGTAARGDTKALHGAREEERPAPKPAAPGKVPPATVRWARSSVRRDLLPDSSGSGPHASAGPQWIELYLELEEDNYDWFEGSISPWEQVDRPEVQWDTKAREHLRLAGLDAPTGQATPTLTTRALALLPHLYSLGVNRALQELGPIAHGKTIELFPLIGFAPHEANFHTLRTNVAVLGDVIVTIRLPNLICPPQNESSKALSSPEPLNIPRRFLPSWDASALQIAEEVARQQAATTRALSDRVRDSLNTLVAGAEEEPVPGARPGEARLEAETSLLDDFGHLTKIAEMADRQLARLLRRMGTYGKSIGGSEAEDIRRRYGFALDEVRALGREIVSARDRHTVRADTARQAEREQFQFIAALAGSAILIPTLVAGIFGANVWVPGERHWEGFGALIAFIVAFATGGTWLIHLAWRKRWGVPTGLRRLLGVVGLVALFAGAGLLVLDAIRH